MYNDIVTWSRSCSGEFQGSKFHCFQVHGQFQGKARNTLSRNACVCIQNRAENMLANC